MFTNQLYLLYVIGVMLIAGLAKEHNIFSSIHNFFISKIKNKKILATILSTISGILPVPGRIVVAAPLFDSITNYKKESKEKFGIVNYIATHHYYLWSPLEKTIILPMAAFGLTYTALVAKLLPLLIMYLAFTAWVIIKYLKTEDISIKQLPKGKHPLHCIPLVLGFIALIMGYTPWIIFSILPCYYLLITKTFNLKKILSYINWKVVISLSLVLFFSTFMKKFIDIDSIFNNSSFSLSLSLLITFCLSWLLGSSSKFSGIVVIACTIFGLKYLPLFFAVDFAGYLLALFSHKCVMITKQYFDTPILEFLKIVGILCGLLIIVGLAVTL